MEAGFVSSKQNVRDISGSVKVLDIFQNQNKTDQKTGYWRILLSH